MAAVQWKQKKSDQPWWVWGKGCFHLQWIEHYCIKPGNCPWGGRKHTVVTISKRGSFNRPDAQMCTISSNIVHRTSTVLIIKKKVKEHHMYIHIHSSDLKKVPVGPTAAGGRVWRHPLCPQEATFVTARELSSSVLRSGGSVINGVTSTMPSPVWGTPVFMMCLCKCLIQSSWTDSGPWKTRSQNLQRENRKKTKTGFRLVRTKKQSFLSFQLPAGEPVHFLWRLV